MAKKKDNRTVFWVIGIILVLVFLYGGNQGWFKGTFTAVINQTTLNQLNNPQNPPGVSCSISFDKSTITQGESVRGTLSDGVNQLCTIYYKFDPTPESIKTAIPWTVDSIVNTGPTGTYQESRIPADVGKYTLAVICGQCVTQAKIITVKKPTIGTCVDSDGDNRNTPGWVTGPDGMRYYDKCLEVGEAVTEYICVGNVPTPKNRACDRGYECIQTRSGGYCRKIIPSWSVGDILYDSGYLGKDLGPGEVGFAHTIDLSNLPPTSPEGECKLQARINTEWGYITPSTCSGLQGNEGMIFSFYDSSGKVWERTDTSPTGLGSLTKCGLSWDGQNLWSFQANKILRLPDCAIGLDYSVQIVVCEC